METNSLIPCFDILKQKPQPRLLSIITESLICLSIYMSMAKTLVVYSFLLHWLISFSSRTCLGPRSMLKMLMDPMGGICMTNDGNAILREIIVQHPAAKSMIEISRTQDEEVGDGTTSVIILAGEMLSVAEPHLTNQMHPTIIISAYRQALDDILEALKTKVSIPVNLDNEAEMIKIVQSCIGTKLVSCERFCSFFFRKGKFKSGSISNRQKISYLICI